MSAPQPDDGRGADALSLWFELSYANYLTVPRSLLESMPDEWQGQLAALLHRLDESYGWPSGADLRIEVRLRDGRGRYVEDALAEYRHPDVGAIEAARRSPAGGDRRAHPRLDVTAPLTPGDIPGRNA